MCGRGTFISCTMKGVEWDIELTDEDISVEGIIERNGIFQVAGRFLLSDLAFECKVLFKWHYHSSFRVCLYPSYLFLHLSLSLSFSRFLSLSPSLSFLRRYSCVSHLCGVVHGAPHGTRGFISWYSNALKHHTRPTRRRQCAIHGGATVAVSARISHTGGLVVFAIETTCSCCTIALLLRLVHGASKNADPRGSGKIMKS